MPYSPSHRTWVLQQVDYVRARLDLADHRMLQLVKLMVTSQDLLPDDLRTTVRDAILGFRYDLAEPGVDNMCTWTENHQLLFATCEYLAGQLYPDEVFANQERTGAQKREAARARLMGWLEARFRHGFSDWLSPAYYELMAVGLVMLVDHAEDDDLATRAAMVLDLLMFDLALHRFDSQFVASGGRVLQDDKRRPRESPVKQILASAFGTPPRFDHSRLWGIFVARERYRVPDVIGEVAAASGARVIKGSHGRDVAEALEGVRGTDDRVRTAWGQQAYLTGESIHDTLTAIDEHGLEQNRLLAPLAQLARKVPSSARARRAALAAMNPIQRGVALHRANVMTYRTPNYLLSSAQHYCPGQFGDQQHLWVAALPRNITVFSTHPGASTLGDGARTSTPSNWVGNGINPEVAQHTNVVLSLHDLRVRKGWFEGRRRDYSHLHFPFVDFDETTLTARAVVGRVGTALVGVAALERLEMVSQTELVQRGMLTGWALVCSDLSQYRSLSAFAAAMKDSTLRYNRGSLIFRMGREYRLEWKGDFRVDGVVQDTNYWRHDNDWASTARGSDVVRVQGRHRTLELDWARGTRREG